MSEATLPVSPKLRLSLAVLALMQLTCVTNSPRERDEPVAPLPPGSEILLWTRAKGQYAKGAIRRRLNEKVFDPQTNKMYRATLYDLQYSKTLEYRGLWLNDIVSSYTPALKSDQVLLHFRNDMIIPVPLSTGSSGQDTISKQIFLAFRIRGEDGKWSTRLPTIERTDDRNQLIRRIEFDYNKVAVSSPAEPAAESERGNQVRRFSPWRYADDLTGLEFVDQEAWNKQFYAGDGPVAAGQAVFLSRCQYCHNVRGVGSTRGWDFDGPVKAYVKRDPESLLNHVKYPNAFAAEYGISMPTQPSFSAEEADTLWLWLRAIATKRPANPYEPPAT